MRLIFAVSVGALGLVGCEAKDDSPGEDSGDSAPPTADDTATASDDTGTDPTDAMPVCADGTWGNLPDAALAVHVSEDGDDTAAGTAAAPVATLDQALALSRAKGGPRTIFVGPGTWSVNLSLAHSVEDSTDDGLGIYGCGPDETTFEADARGEPVVKVSQVADFVLDGFTVSGGRRGIWIWQGASATLHDLVVDGSTRTGIIVDGSETFTSASQVVVQNVVAESTGSGTDIGYGIAVQLGTLEITDSVVTGATGVGILAHFAVLSASSVEVSGTGPDASGYFGRGIQLQELAQGTLTDVVLADNADAAVFALRSLSTVLSGVTIAGTVAGAVPSTATAATSGDGVVISQGDENYDPKLFVASIDDNSITGSARAGVVLEGITVSSCTGNTVSGNGYPGDGSPEIIVQDGAVMPDGSVSDPWTSLDVGLPVNVLTVDQDSLAD